VTIRAISAKFGIERRLSGGFIDEFSVASGLFIRPILKSYKVWSQHIEIVGDAYRCSILMLLIIDAWLAQRTVFA
jgi:hypothetical protein